MTHKCMLDILIYNKEEVNRTDSVLLTFVVSRTDT